jgi:hypothetical protein
MPQAPHIPDRAAPASAAQAAASLS